MTTDKATSLTTTTSALTVEQNGINVIGESERKGVPRDLFWPWCASNISVFGISYGSYVLGFGINLAQALIISVVGVVLSFLLVGLVSLAGKRGSAPTLILSRAAFGVRGNGLPAIVSYLLLVGWETVLVSLATLGTATVFGRLGWGDGDATKAVAFVLVAAIIVAAGILGFEAIMQLQKYLTILTLVVTIGYIALTLDEIDGDAIGNLPSGGGKALIGALVIVITGFGISWVNSAADYSRYLPRNASSSGIVNWVTFGGSLPVVILVVFGVLLAGSDPDLSSAIAADPIGALTTTLPDWFLVPFIIVAVAGLVSGAVLDIYSSGLSLLTLGLPTPRWAAAALDGVIMIAGSIYIIWISDDNVLGTFIAGLITLGVPIAAWCGVFLADLALRRRDYDAVGLFDPRGVYGAFNVVGVGSMVLGTVLGWGLVVSFTKGFTWQGYLMDAFGLGPKETGPWTYANLGVLVALVLPFVLYLLFGGRAVREQERV